MKRTFISYLVLFLILAACASNPTPLSPQPATSVGGSSPTSVPTVVDPAVSPAPLATDTPSVPQPTTYLLPDPGIGLDQLNSYRLSLTVAFKGKRDGQPAEWEDVHTRVFSQQPAVQFTSLTTRDEKGQPLQQLSGSVDQAHYFQAGADQPCQVHWGESPTDQTSINLASSLPPIARAKELGQETINGVPSRHYAISEKSGDAQATGELWLAEPGGYVVRYNLSIQAGEPFFGPGVEGTQTFQYEVSEVNGVQDVPLPPGCPAVLTEIPITSEAQDLVRLPGSLSFATPMTLKEVESFYQTEMKALGWELLARHAEKAQPVALIFTRQKGEESALISLRPETKGVWVAIQMNIPTASK